MALTRRELLQKSRWALALPLLSGLPRSLRAEPVSDLSQLESNITHHFKGLGYKSLPPLNLITGDGFNGGLRFDESFEGNYPAGNSMRIQDCVRVDDFSLEGEAGVLAYFHIFILNQQTPAYQGELFSELLGYLIDDMGLDAEKLVVVSTDKFVPYQPQLKKHGIGAAQFVERSEKEARASGDGSGYFAPKGHPYVSGYDTASIHYPMSNHAPTSATTYPLTGYLELGEVILTDASAQPVPSESGGLGLERVLMAAGKNTDDFAASREKAQIAIQDESARRKVALPSGYSLITG